MSDVSHDTLVIESPDCLKSLEIKDGMARVGAYAVRFSGADQKDLQGEYFTAGTYFGSRNGDGADVLFNHGQAPNKSFDEICERVFNSAKATSDKIGIFVEHVLNLSDEYEAAIADLCAQGKLKWSSGATSHMVKRTANGEIKRWPIAEFSYTPTPAEHRLPSISPLKSVAMDAATVADISQSLKITLETEPTRDEPPVRVQIVDNSSATMTDEDKAAFETAATQGANERADQRIKDAGEILAIASEINDPELGRQWIKDNKPLDAFRAHVLTNVLKARPVTTDAGLIGMDKKEVKSYRLGKACLEMHRTGKLTGLEKEVNDAAIKLSGRDLGGQRFMVADDVHRTFGAKYVKAQNVTTATAGGFLVETDFGPMIELLRNQPMVVTAGATTMGGLTGDVALPVHTSGSTAYWVAETGSLTDSQSVFGQKRLTPKRLGATIPYSTQFLAQSSVDAESFIRNDATTVLSLEKDRAALAGTGVGGEPLGVALTTGINATVTYSGAAAWADIVEHETGIAVDNATIGSMGFIISAATRGKWKTILKDSVAGAGYLISENGTANGYPVYVTNQTFAVANQSLFGVWSQLILAAWQGLEVIVDPFALKKSGQVEITFNELVDILVRQPLAFNVSTDTAAT